MLHLSLIFYKFFFHLYTGISSYPSFFLGLYSLKLILMLNLYVILPSSGAALFLVLSLGFSILSLINNF